MSRASNTLKASDITTTPIKLKYSSSFQSPDFWGIGVQGNMGVNGSVSSQTSIDRQTIRYRGIRQLYYQNYLTSSLLNSSSYYDPNQQSTACSGSSEYEDRSFPSTYNASIYTIAIPPQLFGEQVSVNSLIISPNDVSSYKIIDDGNGNLVDTINNGAHVGNIIYSQGLLIITNQNYTSSLGVPQVWTTYNLDVTTYRNGDIIPEVTNATQWSNLTTGAWCWYNNSSTSPNYFGLGKLYNWYAVTDPRGLAPEGYHIPKDSEWTQLTNALGGVSVAGGKLKSTSGVWVPNTSPSDQIGFNALPGGYRSSAGTFSGIFTDGYWWTCDANDSTTAYYRSIQNTSVAITAGTISYQSALSVRLIKD